MTHVAGTKNGRPKDRPWSDYTLKYAPFLRSRGNTTGLPLLTYCLAPLAAIRPTPKARNNYYCGFAGGIFRYLRKGLSASSTQTVWPARLRR